MKIQLLFVAFIISFSCNAQDSLLTYTRILTFDSLSKDHIYEKALVWCGERFTNSQDAIKVSDKQAGIISGKAFMKSIYKIPKKKDSVPEDIFSDYYFNWMFEIKENKVRFTAYEIQVDQANKKRLVKIIDTDPPITVLFQSSVKTQRAWDLSRKYLLINLDKLLNSLLEKVQKKDDW